MNKRVLFLMSGSIAGYKACQVLSRLRQLGHEVEVVASPWALRFVGEATIEGLTGRPVHRSMFGSGAHMSHIHLVRWADLVIVCPATANTINKLAHGLGDDLMTTLFLAHDFSKPWLIAPAMNSKMYHHPATKESVRKLSDMGCRILETASGVLACGEIGDGKLLDPDLLLQAITSELSLLKPRLIEEPVTLNSLRKPGERRKVLITSGGTSVPIDRVRSITNHSTGKSGAALAEVFGGMGFDVTFLTSKAGVRPRFEDGDGVLVKTKEFETFLELKTHMDTLLPTVDFDLVIHAAAVSDYSLATGPSETKIDSAEDVVLRLKKNPKLLDAIRDTSRNKNVKVVGFKFTATNEEKDRNDKAQKIAISGSVDFLVTNDLHTYPEWNLFAVDPSDRSLKIQTSGTDRHELGLALIECIGDLK